MDKVFATSKQRSLSRNQKCMGNGEVTNPLRVVNIDNVKDYDIEYGNDSIYITNLDPHDLYSAVKYSSIVVNASIASNHPYINTWFTITDSPKENIRNMCECMNNFFVTPEGYRIAIESLKIKRARNRECCICVKRLGRFDKHVTCKYHRKYEP